MDNQNYEDYMRSVLGYQTGNIYANTYGTNNDYYYNAIPDTNISYNQIDEERLNEFYPEIYKMIYPMVCKICNQNSNRDITKDLVEKMTEEIYLNFEADERQGVRSASPLKNGDVRNPNAKESELTRETRQGNFLLRDLIKILILRELGRPQRPNFPGGRPPIMPPPPPRPSRPPMGWR